MLRRALALGALGCWLVSMVRADVTVLIQEWDLPTQNSHPHDPAVAPDGSLWYTAQFANLLGRLDEKSGEIEEFPLDIADSGPHGLIADSQGSMWFTANSRGYIGKLDPSTGEITPYFMPNASARDPHTPIFDQNGTLWFTVQNGNFVGKLDPLSGQITLRQPPTPNAQPYGIAISSEGVPFFCEFGTNKIGRIDPDSLDISEYLVTPGARPRRLTITPDGLIYYTDFARGVLGRLDPSSELTQEWPSPGGDRSQPYGITSTADGIVWYSESGIQPNTLVRFDPTTESFQSWPIPSGGGVIRHMVATPDGRLYLACSGVNKVGIVTVMANK